MKDIHKTFFDMEISENLFNIELSDGTKYWDIIRREVFAAINKYNKDKFQINEDNLKFFSQLTDKLKDIFKLFLNYFILRYIIKKKPKYIFTTFQRNQKNGHIFDNIVDHLYLILKSDSVCVESVNKKSISYKKILKLNETRVPPVFIYSSSVKNDIDGINAFVNEAIYKHFKIKLDLSAVITNSLNTFVTTRNFYQQLLKNHKPKAFFCSDDGTMKGLYSAARSNNITIFEIQHGASPGSILWNYPKELSSNDNGIITPDIFLTFSEYWNSNLKFPVKEKISIGNDNLYTPKINGTDGIAFLSNNNINEDLINLAIQLEKYKINNRIFFKLHPQQYGNKAKIINSLPSASNITVISDEMNNTEILENVNHFVAVRTSLIYVALQAGKSLYLYKKNNYDWDKELIKIANVFSNEKQLYNAIFKENNINNKHKNIPTYFSKFNEEKFLDILDKI